MMESLVWCPIPSAPGYSVNALGMVRNDSRQRVLKSWMNGPYLAVSIYMRGQRKTRLIHSLVLEAFRGLRPKGAFGRHLDDDPLNNALSNLAWGSPSQNTLDSVRNGTHAGRRRKGEGHPLAKLTETCIERVRDMRRALCSQQAIADWLGVARTTIQGIDNGTRWSHL